MQYTVFFNLKIIIYFSFFNIHKKLIDKIKIGSSTIYTINTLDKVYFRFIYLSITLPI